MRRSAVTATVTLGLVIGLVASAQGGSAAQRPEAPVLVDVVVELSPGHLDLGSVAAEVTTKHLGELRYVYRSALHGFSLRMAPSGLAALRQDPRVERASLAEEFQATGAPTPCEDLTTCQRTSLGVLRIDGDNSTTHSGDGRGTVPGNVAVLDSGIAPAHPDLNVVGGRNCYGAGTSWADQNGHGSMVAGFIGALDNGVGRVGVAPGVRLWAVRVLSKNLTATTADILCGVDWVTGTRLDTDPTNDIAVANMSLGSSRKDADDRSCGRVDGSALHRAICRSVLAGVTYVAGAGNAATDLKDFEPAAYDEVLTATGIADSDGLPGGTSTNPACDDFAAQTDDTPATFSNYATLAADQAHIVAAPAVCIGSTWYDGTYGIWSGTSFAAPLVAGTVALCLSGRTCRGLAPSAVRDLIVADSTRYSARNPSYGFVGDLNHPIAGRTYGPLVRAGDF